MPKRVLVIEDLPAIQRLVQVCLAAAGCEVTTRSDGATGLASALTDRPDLVVLDIGLPRVDGWEVLKQLRADERTVDLPILVLTAHGTDDNRARAMTAGANEFMPKPFRPDDLRRVTLRLLVEAGSHAAVGAPVPTPATQL